MDIFINGVIGDEFSEEESVNTGAQLGDKLKDLPAGETVNVKINSVGGSVFEGFQMYNQLKALSNPVNTEINGMAASIASLIALAGDQVKMSEVSMFMIHRASTMAMGNQEELEKQADILKSIDDTLISVYAVKTGKSNTEIENLLSDETWMTSNEALDEGFVDEIINKIDAKMAAKINLETNEKVMKLKSLFDSFKNESTEEVATEEVVETPVVNVDPDEEAEEAPEAPEEEPATEAKYVTIEQFNKLLERIEQMAEALDSSVEQVAKEEAEKAVAAIKTGLKKTSAVVPQANGSEDIDPTVGWVDPQVKHRMEMKEIENKTRLS